MPYIIVIDKTGTVKETNIKEYNVNDLYKKANFKSAEGFVLNHKWEIELKNTKHTTIAIYGKKNGKAGQENKYEFPPPIDNVLFFGGCVLISENPSDVTKIKDLRITEWKSIYENLMGGFEDLGNKEENDEEEEEEEDEDKEPNEYICDDFLVEDDDVDYDDISIPEEEEEEEEEPHVSKKSKNKKKEKKQPKKNNNPIELELQSSSNYLDCQSELEEEAYFA